MENNKIIVINENGEEVTADVLLYFKIAKNNKEYILYTFKEIDDQAMETIHASELVRDDQNYRLQTIDADDWLEVKDIMREIIRNEEE